jgi:ribonucleoside-diphosphate reductase alpha chain
MGLKGITVYRDSSRHEQVLHMTSENAKKTFDTRPSEVVTDYVNTKITNPYVRKQVDNALRLIIPQEVTHQPQIIEEEKEENLCPTCKNNLVFVEGCSLCIECGFSGCTSG